MNNPWVFEQVAESNPFMENVIFPSTCDSLCLCSETYIFIKSDYSLFFFSERLNYYVLTWSDLAPFSFLLLFDLK